MPVKKNDTSFKIGNNEAEKWNEETTLKVLNQILSYVVENNTCFIGTALVNNDLYKELWAYFNLKFENNTAVFKIIKRIEQIIESNLANAALDGDKNPTMAIFILKNKHDWTDKQDIELSNKPEKPRITFDDNGLE